MYNLYSILYFYILLCKELLNIYIVIIIMILTQIKYSIFYLPQNSQQKVKYHI